MNYASMRSRQERLVGVWCLELVLRAADARPERAERGRAEVRRRLRAHGAADTRPRLDGGSRWSGCAVPRPDRDAPAPRLGMVSRR